MAPLSPCDRDFSATKRQREYDSQRASVPPSSASVAHSCSSTLQARIPRQQEKNNRVSVSSGKVGIVKREGFWGSLRNKQDGGTTMPSSKGEPTDPELREKIVRTLPYPCHLRLESEHPPFNLTEIVLT